MNKIVDDRPQQIKFRLDSLKQGQAFQIENRGTTWMLTSQALPGEMYACVQLSTGFYSKFHGNNLVIPITIEVHIVKDSQ